METHLYACLYPFTHTYPSTSKLGGAGLQACFCDPRQLGVLNGHDAFLFWQVHKRGSDQRCHRGRAFEGQFYGLEDQMQVSVLVRDGADEVDTPLLVLTFGVKAELPEHLRCRHWRELATVTIDDRLLWPDQFQIEHDIERLGYSLLSVRPEPEGACSCEDGATTVRATIRMRVQNRQL